MTGVRCVCGAKLMEALSGEGVVKCWKCKRYVLLTGTSGVQIVDTPHLKDLALTPRT